VHSARKPDGEWHLWISPGRNPNGNSSPTNKIEIDKDCTYPVTIIYTGAGGQHFESGSIKWRGSGGAPITPPDIQSDQIKITIVEADAKGDFKYTVRQKSRTTGKWVGEDPEIHNDGP